MAKYIIRLDDACEKMNLTNWEKIEILFDKYNIKPLVGIIPNCQDKEMEKYEKNLYFWNNVKKWQKKKWTIALHGYDHVYISNEGGVNPIHKRSEFAGVAYELQTEKIKKGYESLLKKGVNPQVFFAPSHTFDINTINILQNETNIRIISDTFSLKPYKEKGMIFIPQQFGKVRKFPIGIITFCYHPNTMTEIDFEYLEDFLKKNQYKFISIQELNLKNLKNLDIISLILRKLYFLLRRIKKYLGNGVK